MREIKFRTWDKKRKKMYYDIQKFYDTLGYDLNDCPTNCFQTFNCFLQNKNQIVMQYTGLKDKNGKEVYEGDIVKYMDFDMGIEGDGDEYVNRGKISYDEESAMFFVTNRNMAELEEIWLDDILEVIGNICENPNLLK